MNLRKCLLIVLALMMVFTLAACSEGGDDGVQDVTGLSGTYYLYSMDAEGVELGYDMLLLAELSESYLKLNGDGTGELYLQGEETEKITYDEKDGSISFDDGSAMSVTVEGDSLIVDAGMDTVFCFALDGSSTLNDAKNGSVNAGTDTAGTDDSGSYDWWEGDWYGWWMIFDGDGYYADYIDYSWDCCMYIEPMGDHHLISIWDEDFNDYENNCLAEVLVDIDLLGGDGFYGEAVSVEDENNFFWNAGVGAGEWVIDPEVAGVDNMLIIEGSFTDADGEYCEYGVVLTKWGYEWNEADSTYPPYYYEEFFLPLMEAGEPLPIVFEPAN